MTIQEIADMYRVSTKTVRRWISRGDLKAERLPGNRMIRVDIANIANLTKPVGPVASKPRRGITGYWSIKTPKTNIPLPPKFVVITDFFPESES